MGHTVPAMRWIIYDKLHQLKKLTKSLREPEKSIAESLLYHIHSNISAITLSNPLPKEIESTMIYAILIEQKKRLGLHIDDATLLIFSYLILHELQCRANSSIATSSKIL